MALGGCLLMRMGMSVLAPQALVQPLTSVHRLHTQDLIQQQAQTTPYFNSLTPLAMPLLALKAQPAQTLLLALQPIRYV
jgi:small neutral amino acid transporter SnatA (MarC family)